jgi:hypothetical protein
MSKWSMMSKWSITPIETQLRTIDGNDLATRDRQLTAVTRGGIPGRSKLNGLGAITQSVFVANRDRDAEHRSLLARDPPTAQLESCPDSGGGFLDQHQEAFLNGR